MCAEGIAATGIACMTTPSLTSVTALELVTTSAAFVFNIDSTSHMRNDKIWIFAGTEDSVVKPSKSFDDT